LKRGYWRESKLTKLRQKDKDELRRVKDLAREGEQWSTLKQDPEAMRLFIQ